jgi:signal transduction histidine kinase
VQYTTQVKQDLLELNQTLDSLLLLSRLDDPLAPLPPAQDLHLRRLLNEIVNNYSSAIQSKKLEVAIDCPAHLRLHFSKDHFQILLSNLISNAIKYNTSSGRLGIAAAADHSTIRISVSDTGPGIPDAEQPRVFEKFYRGKTASASGTGLGLSLVKRICDLHRLGITLSSSASGTVFTLSFP